MADFTHLHLHTEYSLLDGLNRTETLLKKVQEDGMESVAITDHGVMYGVPEFFFMAKDFGVKPIIGCEIYVSPKERTLRREVDGLKYYHLVLIAKNFKGYQNLNKIVSIGQLEGFYYRPRVDREILKKYSEGLICSSACLAGPVARHILRNQENQARDWLEFLNTTFKDGFFLELQRNGFNFDDLSKVNLSGLNHDYQTTIKEQIIVNTKLKEFADEYKVPLLATTDAHFLNKEDSNAQEILFAIKDGNLVTDPNRRLGYLDTYVKTQKEMKSNFSDITEPLDNSMKIAEMVENYDITFDRVQPQYYDMPKGKTAQEELRKQVFDGAKEKYGEVTKELEERIDYELDVIHQKGYDDYFLVVSDIMKWSQRQGIVVGVRGSVAGSVVAYCLEIIHVEPIEWELYFERFLNPERPSPPDIDMDIQDDRRDEVIKYVEDTYGKENVAAICAIGRMKTKAAIRDVARVMGIDLQIADTLSKMVHVVFGKVKKISQMMEEDEEFAKIINSAPELQRLKENVEKIEGMARHISTHACGYLVTPEPLVNYVSIQKETKGGNKTITQNEGTWIEALGLMKFDFLGLRNLTIIKNTFDLIDKYHGKRLDVDDIPHDDKKTFELFTAGETTGVFQFEGGAMRKHLQQLKPENLEDICFMVSAYRPGPMQYIPDYIKRKHGEQETTYLIPEMEPILNNTYGFAIYQEQVIKIAVDIAGYTMGQADLLRRAMGKKKMKIMKQEEPKFKKGVMALGYDKKIADETWNYLLPFADYGFNKAHGAGYALVAYWCAYLKAHYPIEFMAGLMHSDIDDNDRIVIDMNEAKHMGFDILPPDINHSEMYFTIENRKNIRFGLGAIKNVSDKSIDVLVKERNKEGEFKSLDDLIKRVQTININKKSLECLIKVGALDKFGSRNQLLAIMPEVWDRISNLEKKASNGQSDLFGMIEDSVVDDEITPLPEVNKEDNMQKINWEKELIGTYVSEHPLTNYHKMLLTSDELKTLKEAEKQKEGVDTDILCIINSVRIIHTKRGNKPMAFIQIEDMEGKAEGVVFTKAYERLRDQLNEFYPLVLRGKTNFREERFSILVDDIIEAKKYNTSNKIKIDIRGEKDKDKISSLKKAIVDNPGNVDMEIVYGGQYAPKSIFKQINPTEQFIRIISPYRSNGYH